MILKVLFAFLLGFILGAFGAGFLVTSPAGNYLIAPVIAANPRVQELESKFRAAEDQRANVSRQLDRVTDRLEQMAQRFEDLQHRFEAVQRPTTDRPAAPPAQGGDTPATGEPANP